MTGKDDDEQQAPGTRSGTPQVSGGITANHVTGGAIAVGDGAVAEDRSHRTGQTPPPPAPAGWPEGRTPAPVPGSVIVNTLRDTPVAVGRNARAVNDSVQVGAEMLELLRAVTTLRSHLPVLARTEGDDIDEVDQRLAEVQTAIEQTGRVEPGRLDRLRSLLTGSVTAVSGLASTLTVIQAITQLLG
ncbi:hypothetical protein ACGFZP_14290 [Kitasatospora sp. NPDC048239]|uniref:hypothetical protein n=1 Tax=Kitasatospora sp. NPDC048239 TaxID=3364046 RepID=UPI0037234B31